MEDAEGAALLQYLRALSPGVRIYADGTLELEQLSPVPAEQGRAAALIRGVAAGIAKQGGVRGGFDAYTTSDVLRGSGLSSSAAFEVVIGTCLLYTSRCV